jgi:hypothetical protein
MAWLHASAHCSLPTIKFQGLVFVEARNWQASPPTQCKHITFDAITMYTNIDINDSINQIMKFLSEIWDKYDFKAVEEAMNIVMWSNRIQFGDLIFHQTCGVAMGMLPAPTIANLYVAIYEHDHIIPLIGSYLMYYKRFINNGFAVWLHDKDLTTCK